MSDMEMPAPYGVRRQIGLSAYWFSLNFQSAALLTIVIPTTLDRLSGSSHTSQLARLAVLGALIAMLIPPVAGVVSDRARSRGGQRRPMLIWGTGLNVIGLAVAADAQAIPWLTVGFFTAVFGQNVATAAYQAMMPEAVPRAQWGAASGYMGVASLLGTIVGLAIVSLTSPAVGYAAMAVAAGLGAGYTCLAVRERRDERTFERPSARIRNRRDFYVVFLARFMVIFGQTLLMTYVLYFFQDVLRVHDAAASTALVAVMALVGAAFSAWAAGAMSDRLDRPILVSLAGLPMAAAALGFGLVPSLSWVLLFAVCWGLGYGAYLSVDWALALDAIPDLQNVARDLGVWGIASNLPAVLAPAVGGVLLVRILPAATAYHDLFLMAGTTFLLGSVIVLWVRGKYRQTGWTVGLRLLVAIILRVYVGVMYRVRVHGGVARSRGATLVVANHVHDLEGMVVPPTIFLGGPWGVPVHSAGSGRLFEPGFLVTRTPGWLRWMFPRLNLRPILTALGVLPIENQPRRRPIISIAYEILGRHGNVRLREVFEDDVLAELGRDMDHLRLRDCWRGRLVVRAQKIIPYAAVREPYRTELRELVRGRLEAQLGGLEEAMRQGATVFLTPEGRYTEDGRMSRMRAALSRLAPLADDLFLAPLAYDPFAPGPLSMTVRLMRASSVDDLTLKLQAARPITPSQLIADCFRDGLPHAPDAVLAHCEGVLATLPEGAFVSRELRRHLSRTVHRWLREMRRRGLLQADDGGCLRPLGRWHPRFPQVPDIFSYSCVFFDETLHGLGMLSRGRAELPESKPMGAPR